MLLDMNKFADGIKAIAEENKMLKEENKMLKESAIADLVLCKDCRYCTEYYDRDGYPYWECAEWDSGTDADGFCHYGEKKKEMTKEEAMYLLNNLRSVAEGKEDEAIDIAIEALKAELLTEGRYEKAIKILQEMPKYINSNTIGKKLEVLNHTKEE